MRHFARAWLLVIFVVLSACGGDGGGGGNGGPPPVSAPSGLSYPAPSTASNSGGTTTATVSITVNDTPAIAYEQSEFTLTTGLPVTLSARSTGGAVTQWTIAPQLPAGLALNATNGTISGTPTDATGPAQYRVSAQNSGGVAFFDLTIRIDSGVLLELGHAASVQHLRSGSNRILSLDYDGYWALWNDVTTERVAGGSLYCGRGCNPGADLAGGTIVIEIAGGLQVRAASDGRILATINTASNWWQLARDGSYVVAGNATGLRAWSPAGAALFARDGDYSQAKVSASPSEVRVAAGPAGANVIEKIAVATGAVSNTPAFDGTFHSWFADGERFLSRVGNTVWVYAHDGQQQDLRALPTVEGLAGLGNWFWTTQHGNQINIYEVGASATVAASYSFPYQIMLKPSGTTIGIVGNSANSFSVIDLSGASPGRTDLTSSAFGYSAYTRTDSGRFIGTNDGLVADATAPASLTLFSYGTVRSIAASANRIAVATAAGPILYFDAVGREQEGQVALRSRKVLVSADGTVLAAAADTHYQLSQSDRTIKIFQLPSGTEIQSLPYLPGRPNIPEDIFLSASGQMFGKGIYTPQSRPGSVNYLREVTAVGSTAVVWSDTLSNVSMSALTWLPILLSPDGSRIAASNSGGGRPSQHSVTNLYLHGSLNNALPGWGVGWIDNDRLLLHRYVGDQFGFPRYSTSVVVSPDGTVLHSVALPHNDVTSYPRITEFQVVDMNRIYSRQLNQIVSLTDGGTVWSSPNVSQGQGAVTGTHVVFNSGNTVRIEPY